MAKSAYIGIDGTARKVKKIFVGVPKVVSPTVALSSKALGEKVKLKVNGVPRNFIVVQKGNPDTSMYDSSCDDTWLLMDDIYEVRKWHNSDGNDYENSTIHSYLNDAFFSLFDSDIQSVIKQVKIPYCEGIVFENPNILSGENGLTTKIFLLSGAELNWSSYDSSFIPDDGAPLSYFAECAETDIKRIAYFNGGVSFWYLRSPYCNRQLLAECAVVVTKDGRFGAASTYEDDGAGIRPALILPSNLSVDGDGNVLSTLWTLSTDEPKIVSFARKVKKAWVGVGGIARLFFGGGELSYYGMAEPLSLGRWGLGATSIGNYAIFAGGSNNNTSRNTVDVYDKSLTHSTPANLTRARYEPGAASIGDYALFAGGGTSSSGQTAVVDVYDKSLTQSTATELSSTRRTLGSATTPNYALFAGGYKSSSNYLATVDAYNSSLTHSNPTGLSLGRENVASASAGNYAIFAGGSASSNTRKVVDAYDDSLTRTVATSLAIDNNKFAGTNVGKYALFAGGLLSGKVQTYTVAYDESLTQTTPTELSIARYNHSATTVGNYAVFAAGDSNSNGDVTDAYDESLTRITLPSSSAIKRQDSAATTIGDYALFAGGMVGNGSQCVNMVDVYQVS